MLSQEFGIKDLIISINKVKKKYLEYEKILENQASSPIFNQPMSEIQHDLEQKNQLISELQQKYDSLLSHVLSQDQQIKALDDKLRKQKIESDTNLQQISDHIKTQFEEFNNLLNSIEKKVETDQEVFVQQINNNNKNCQKNII